MGGRGGCCSEDEKAREKSEIEQGEPKSRRFVPAEGQTGPGQGGWGIWPHAGIQAQFAVKGRSYGFSIDTPPHPLLQADRAQLPGRGEQGCSRQTVLCPGFLCSRVRQRTPRVPLVPGRSRENVSASHGAPSLDGQVAGASHPSFPLGASKGTADLRNMSLMQVSP